MLSLFPSVSLFPWHQAFLSFANLGYSTHIFKGFKRNLANQFTKLSAHLVERRSSGIKTLAMPWIFNWTSVLWIWDFLIVVLLFMPIHISRKFGEGQFLGKASCFLPETIFLASFPDDLCLKREGVPMGTWFMCLRWNLDCNFPRTSTLFYDKQVPLQPCLWFTDQWACMTEVSVANAMIGSLETCSF